MIGDLLAYTQRLLDGKWRHAQEARAACRDGAWAAFVARVAPPRPILLGHLDRSACIERTIAMLAGPIEVTCGRGAERRDGAG